MQAQRVAGLGVRLRWPMAAQALGRRTQVLGWCMSAGALKAQAWRKGRTSPLARSHWPPLCTMGLPSLRHESLPMVRMTHNKNQTPRPTGAGPQGHQAPGRAR